MECTIDWGGPSGMLFVATSGSGHVTAMDGAVEEMVLAGTGGCTAYDVVLILKRGRHAVTGCSVKLQADRAETDPKVFTRINFAFTVTGANLPRSAVERAVQLSHEKYCSASAMLAKTAEMTFTVDVVDTNAAPTA